ncbi:tyrosine-type recombinase/integrase [Methylomonas sp. 2BW1-5-20]|uniref:tyrosine-type recombinase/integrase n=1 Tax=Methylomonas sp. 2BW1-5-20 TaxID=3376686 RepID=UPI00404FF4D2
MRRLEVFREEILAAISLGTFDYSATFPDSKRAELFKPQAALTISSRLNKWLDRKERHLKASTYDTYRRAILQLKTGLGDITIADIKKKDMRAWCETKTCSNKAIANLTSVLRAALQDAVDDELIDSNPLSDFRFRRAEAPKETEDVDPFTAEEQLAILSALNGQHRNLIQFSFWTGLRPSEAIALEWTDIDFIKGVVQIKRAKTFHARKPETTKTRAGLREVKLLQPALAAIDDQKHHTFLDGRHVFKNPNTSKPWTGDRQIRKFWGWALKRAGVRYRNPYQTRHTYASMMLTAGESLPWISRQMGHSSVIMTTKAYARFIKDSLPDAGNKAVELFAEKRT